MPIPDFLLLPAVIAVTSGTVAVTTIFSYVRSRRENRQKIWAELLRKSIVEADLVIQEKKNSSDRCESFAQDLIQCCRLNHDYYDWRCELQFPHRKKLIKAWRICRPLYSKSRQNRKCVEQVDKLLVSFI